MSENYKRNRFYNSIVCLPFCYFYKQVKMDVVEEKILLLIWGIVYCEPCDKVLKGLYKSTCIQLC